MPAARKACDRCRKQKARCLWSEDSAICTRCHKLGHTCSAPATAVRTSLSSEATEASAELPTPGPSTGRNTASATPIVEPAVAGTRRYLFQQSTSGQASVNSASGVLAGSSMIRIPTARQSTFPPLPARLPKIEGTCAIGTCYLPAADESHGLLQEYLHDFNSKIPIYSPEALYGVFRDCYSGAADEQPLAWCIVYTTVAITHRLRAMSPFPGLDDTSQAEWYLNAVLGRLPELLVQKPCIRLVQACVAIAILLETSARCERAPFFVSTAVRMAQELGYNELDSISDPQAVKLEQSYVFWIAFFMDTHMSFSHQRTSSLRLLDISTPIPAASITNWWEPSNDVSEPGQWNLNVSALQCSLAVIEAEVAEHLFTVEARAQSDADREAAYNAALTQLATWRESNSLSNLGPADVLRSMYRSDIMLSISLEAAYFRTLYQLRATWSLNTFMARVDSFSPASLVSVMSTGTSASYADAQRLLSLMVLVPQGNVATTWLALKAVVTAICTVLRPEFFNFAPEIYRRTDLPLCRTILAALLSVEHRGVDAAHIAIIEHCHEVLAIAERL